MSLKIKTFSNSSGGNATFKALGHPLAAPKAHDLIKRLAASGPVAIYDPQGQLGDLDALYDLSGINIAGVFVQNLADIGGKFRGHETQPVSSLPRCAAKTVFICAFDSAPLLGHIKHLIPANADVAALDDARLPGDMLTNARQYLNTLNFATNFVFFRDAGGHHTRLVTANYWSGYGAKNTAAWYCLFDGDGKILAQWREKFSDGTHIIAVDSKEVRARFGLGEFTGSLFVHVIGVAGHDIVKYALDTYGDDDTILSCTHDANAWPAALYAGLPAPKNDEKVILWVQNSHSCPIPANAIGLNRMGSGDIARLDKPIAPFATYALDVSSLMPDAKWPQQLEVQAGQYFVRPRYEVTAANGRRRMAHVNVERTDLQPDPGIPGLANVMGKGYILPAPILPIDRWRSIALPTPMSTAQDNLPLAMLIYDAEGNEVLRHNLGKLERKDSVAFDAGEILRRHGVDELAGGFGHMELVYDFSKGGSADGWLHGLFRYEDIKSGHTAETSFGSHIFNTVMVYKNEPQSYAGKPPGLSTRLFLRMGHDGADTICHLIYPASTPWRATSQTDLVLFDSKGTELVKKTVNIACSGSLLWRTSEIFTDAEREKAGGNAYVMIRDATCRLFGYHGLAKGDKAFSLDHMFGF
jgi:hypothetical protein